MVEGPPFASAIPLDDLPFGGPAVGQFGVVVTGPGIAIDGSLDQQRRGRVLRYRRGLTANDVVVGIGNNGGTIAGGIVNNGIVDILGKRRRHWSCDFANAVGIAATDVTGTTFLNAAGASLLVNALRERQQLSANPASANAIGVFQDAEATDTAVANVTNNGLISVQATAIHAPTNAATGPDSGRSPTRRRVELFRRSRA